MRIGQEYAALEARVVKAMRTLYAFLVDAGELLLFLAGGAAILYVVTVVS